MDEQAHAASSGPEPERAQPAVPPELERSIAAMVQAIEIEIAAHGRRSKAERAMVGRNGRLDARSGEELTYSFDVTDWPASWRSTRAFVRPARSDGPWLEAEVVASGGPVVTICTREELPEPVDKIELRENETGSLRVLKARLGVIGQATSPVDHRRSAMVLGRRAPSPGEDRDPCRWVTECAYADMNPEQQGAVRQALGSDLTYIWGPPGTGKTDVLTSVIEGCFRQHRSVLFVAPTNVAVDQALIRICDRLQREPALDQGLVRRVVKPAEGSELDVRYGDRVDVQRALARLNEKLGEDIEREREAQRELREKIGARRTADDLAARLDELRHEAATLAARIAKLDAAATRLGSSIAELESDIDRARKSTGWSARRKQRRLPELEKRLANLKQQRLTQTDAAAELRKRLKEVESAHSRVARELSDAMSRLGAESMSVDQLERLARAVSERLQTLAAQRDRAHRKLDSHVRIVGTTAAMAVQRRLPVEDFDTVIVDEAGMLDLPTAFYVGGLSRRRLVFAGDFRQLPTVVVATTDRKTAPDDRTRVQQWYARDPFASGGLVSAEGHLSRDPRMLRLHRQYRMRDAICKLVNEVAYPDAPLCTARKDASTLAQSALIDAPLVLIDTGLESRSRRSVTRNEIHVAVVRELVRGLQYDGVLPGRNSTGGLPGETVGVITPYRDQKADLKRTLIERFGSAFDGLVDTVHRFQGSERPLIIVDTVAGAAANAGPFFRETGRSSSTCRLLNVALSRARDCLVVVANVAFLREKLPPNSEVRVMLDHLERHGQVLRATQLIPVRGADELARLPDEQRERPAFFPADEVPRALDWDMGQARRRVEIYCPFLAPKSIARWNAPIRDALGRGVAVTVFTRPSFGEARHERLVAHLVDTGCFVEYRAEMHEKVVVIDDVLWHGSLNLLAHYRSTDLMMRLVSAAACENVKRVLDQAQPTRPTPRFKRVPTPAEDRPAGTEPGTVGDSIEDMPLGLIQLHISEMVLERGRVSDAELPRAFTSHFDVVVPSSWNRKVVRFAWTAKSRRYVTLADDVWMPGDATAQPDARYGEWTFRQMLQRARELVSEGGGDPVMTLIAEACQAARVPALLRDLAAEAVARATDNR